MQPGHEECGHWFDYLHVFGRSEPLRTILNCDHEHVEPVQASDVLGNGPTVADYCLCCDTMMRRPGYA